MRQKTRSDEEAPLLACRQIKRQLRTEKVCDKRQRTPDAMQKLRLHRRERRVLSRRRRKRTR